GVASAPVALALWLSSGAGERGPHNINPAPAVNPVNASPAPMSHGGRRRRNAWLLGRGGEESNRVRGSALPVRGFSSTLRNASRIVLMSSPSPRAPSSSFCLARPPLFAWDFRRLPHLPARPSWDGNSRLRSCRARPTSAGRPPRQREGAWPSENGQSPPR